ncbi:hypothetical protein Q8F55_001719 [Vanrija albida]|uniref:Zn(2)-C6 fungal-type domain-containing protein n=1 Tax=Vanrija albida TaxID=181172 RepID=A0ABR3Q8E1_9TREE
MPPQQQRISQSPSPAPDRGSPSSSPSSATKRKRSRAGCYTCRRRKKACDSARPVCGSCTRLGIPCVFPKLYRNAKGDLVPSPQPNGRTRKLPRGDSLDPNEAEPPAGSSTAASADITGPPTHTTVTTSPGVATTGPHTQTSPEWHRAGRQPSPERTYEEAGDAEDESALDQFLASLGDAESGQAWAWPLLDGSSSGLELDLGAHGTSAGSWPGGVHGVPLSAGYDSHGAFASNKMVTAAAVLEHLPTLYDYFVTSFSPVLSVLGGPGHNPVLDQLLPVVQRSPLVMCALIAWAATHRAGTGHPYHDVARVSAETVEMQIDSLDITREFTNDEREEYMWTLIILGGVEIVRGDSKGWVRRLPMARNLLEKALESIDFKSSPTWQSLAYNTAYHDILSVMAMTRGPKWPAVYDRILNHNNVEIDGYMGATRRIFYLLTEISTLAGKVAAVLDSPESDDKDRELTDLVAQHEAILARLRAVDIPLGVFVQLPIGTDRSHLIVAIEAYRATAELYLRQTVLRAGSSDLQCRLIAKRLMHNLRLILGTPHESQMMFPLFLAGVSTSHDAGRTEIINIFTKFSERTGVRSVITIINLLLEVWKRDPDGTLFVDWRKMAEESGVAVSFG